ncbi:type VI secretion system baseplate subunit TssE [Aquabacter spiritensis]|uniref:Type VI secretion system protein ImpF n=1 Tax=Aquabacter spiritensis TaxID=933073 RepID=A0A4R3LS74_9HYPH|nr:type VI secretion system baseplate subunit TssE [Aquabacter spiritensis]TCT02459.1 type VI secretion system protein ImpF [Aquabacter spiritensis]
MNDGPAVGLSLIDRLFGDEAPSLARVRAGLKRDLEDLLNTRERVKSWPAVLGELERSLFSYGIVDLATANFSTEERRAAVVEEIGATIRRLEPRLTRMNIAALQNADPSDRSLRIRIEAQIIIDSESEPVQFNTIIDPIAGAVALTDQS